MKFAYKKHKNKIAFSIIVLLIGSTGCKKFVDVQAPVTSVTGASVYSSDATAAAVLTGLYTNLSTTGYLSFGFRSLSAYAGLSADEFSLWSGVNNASQIAYYRNSLSSTTYGFEFWTFIYPYIFTCNSAIQGLSSS